MDYFASWLEILILAHFDKNPTHGYEVAEKLNSGSSKEIKSGTLYPILRRLEKRGSIKSEWSTSESGPARKIYSLTAQGSKELVTGTREWKEFAKNMSRVLDN